MQNGFLEGKDLHIVLAVAVLFLAVQLFYFPQFYSSSDEHHYLANSFQIQRGYLGEENPEKVCNASVYSENGYISGQYIGRSLFLVPFVWFGFDAVMFSGTIIHLLNLALLVLIFRKLNIREIFALPYLFFPVIFWQARTLYAGILVLTFFLSAFYFYTSKKEKHFVLAGVLFGLAMLVRYDAALGIAAFLFVPLLKDRRKLLFLLAGFLPVLVLILLFNSFTYGGLLSTGYGVSGSSLLASTIFGADIASILFYSIFLLAVYPLMLASPFLSKKFKEFRLEYLLFSIPLLFLAARYPPLFFNNSVFTIFLRIRYALPLCGMLLIPYGCFLQSLSEKFPHKKRTFFAIYFAVIVLLFTGTIFASFVHSNFLNERKAVFEQIYENTPENALVIGSSDDCIYFLNEMFPQRRYISVDLNQQLAGNPKELKLEDFIGENTYVLNLRYSNRISGTVGRQTNTDAERARMDEFISDNCENIELVSEFNEPHSLKIYRWIE